MGVSPVISADARAGRPCHSEAALGATQASASFRCARRERVAKPLQRDFAFPSVIYHWEWIIRDQLLGGRFSESRRINILEFRHPAFDVVARRMWVYQVQNLPSQTPLPICLVSVMFAGSCCIV